MGRYLALVPMALALAACGGGGGGALSVDPVAEAATKTAKAGGEHADFQARVELPSIGSSFTMTGSGDFDNAKHIGRMSVDFSGDPQISGKGEEVLKGTVIYMRFPFFENRLPGGKRWLKIDLQKAGRSVGIDFNALMQSSNGDPAQMLRYLEAASRGVHKVGTETVAGASTTHYKAVIDFDKLAQTRPNEKSSIRRIEQLTGVKLVPVEAWIDGEHYVRKLTQTMTMRLPPQGTTMKMTTTYELSDFGKHVSVALPPDDQVFDASNLAGG
jgi:hypothetical protein